MGGPTGAREIGPHRGGGGKREKAISPGRGGAGEEIVNAHLSLGLEIIPIVHRNYDGWTIRWSLPARRPTRDHEFPQNAMRPQPKAWLRSTIRSSGSSIPTEMRISAGVIPSRNRSSSGMSE